MGCCASKKSVGRKPRPPTHQDAVIPLNSTKDTNRFPEKTEPTQVTESDQRAAAARLIKPEEANRPTKLTRIPSVNGLAVEPPATSRTQVTVNTTQGAKGVSAGQVPGSSQSSKQLKEWKNEVREKFVEVSDKTQDNAEEINETDRPASSSTAKAEKSGNEKTAVEVKKEGPPVANQKSKVESAVRPVEPTQEDHPEGSKDATNSDK